MLKCAISLMLLVAVCAAFDAGNGCFIENQGQWDDQVLYYACLDGAGIWLTEDAVILQYSVEASSCLVTSTLSAVSSECRVSGLQELPHSTNYFLGDSRENWVTGVPGYREVLYENIYPNIDMVARFDANCFSCDFTVNPGGDPSDIRISHDDSELIIPVSSGGFIIPSAVSTEDTAQQNMASPDMEYSTYFGGTAEDRSYSMGVDITGAVYVTGRTSSADYPVQDPFQAGFGGGSWDVFVTKLSPDGSQLVYSTFIGGSGAENGYGVKVDSEGCAYVTGPTESADFPLANPLQGSLQGTSDAFLLKLSPAGDSLIYSTYVGGTGTERGRDIAVDQQGRAHLIGNTSSADFPVVNPYQSVYGGGIQDAFILRVSSSGDQIDYSSYLGGSSEDLGEGVHVDPDGYAYITGETSSSDFPVSSAYQSVYGGGDSDGFLAKFTPAGTQVSYSTYLGGSGEDWSSNVAGDPSGISITGFTSSSDFPVENAYQGSLSGTGSAFVTKFSSSGSTLEFSTYFGGTGSDQGRDIAVDPFGGIHVTGYTSSADFPVLNAYQDTYAGGANDCFVLKLHPDGQQLDYSTYLGGSDNDSSRGIIVDSSGGTYVTGGIASTDFPVINAYQAAFAGGFTDYFIAKLGAFFTGIGGPSAGPAGQLGIDNVYPNPFSGNFSVSVTVPVSGPLEVTLHDCSGRLVSVVSDESSVASGVHSFHWTGEKLPSGIYLVRACSPGCEPAHAKLISI